MTEADWLACDDPNPMLEFLRDRGDDRKFRLFAVSAVWPYVVAFGDDRTREVLEVIHEASDGRLNREDLCRERDKIGEWGSWMPYRKPTGDLITRAAGVGLYPEPIDSAFRMASAVTFLETVAPLDPADEGAQGRTREELGRLSRSRLTSNVRDIFGNPFRSVGIRRQWRTSTAVALASQMYESRDFSPMPILADALQDAGCEDAAVLDHCRGPGPHARGCWVVDMLLGKS